jgi:hypothetical protein
MCRKRKSEEMGGRDRHPVGKVALNLFPNDCFTRGKHSLVMAMRFHHDPRTKRKIVGVADRRLTTSNDAIGSVFEAVPEM